MGDSEKYEEMTSEERRDYLRQKVSKIMSNDKRIRMGESELIKGAMYGGVRGMGGGEKRTFSEV